MLNKFSSYTSPNIKNYEERFEILAEQFLAGRLYLEMWWEMSGKKDNMTKEGCYLNSENNRHFFNYVMLAFHDYFITKFNAAFEKGKSTNSFLSLDSLKSCKVFNELIQKHSSTIKGINIIRNNSTSHNPFDRIEENNKYTLANLTPSSLKEFSDDISEYINWVEYSNFQRHFILKTDDNEVMGSEIIKRYINQQPPPKPTPGVI